MATQHKSFVDYVDPVPTWWESKLQDYADRPATAFLREAVHIADSMNQCRRWFPKKRDTAFNKDSQDSIYRLGAAALSSMMSHFETYQRSLFAGILEMTRFVPNFRLVECCKRLEKDSQLSFDINRFFAYRGRSAPIGQLIGDHLGGWHSPHRVNSHFQSLVPDFTFFSGADIEQLEVLWQLRHSVVHTGGWLTHADAQKVHTLVKLSDRPILLNHSCVEAVARRLHVIVGRSTRGIGHKFRGQLSLAIGQEEIDAVDRLFEVTSPRESWLRAV